MNRTFLLAWVFLGAFASAQGAGGRELAPRRYALLIGIDSYLAQGVAKLNYAERDAETLARKLEAQDYVVTILKRENATRKRIVEHLVNMQETLKPKDTFVLYYAGHGIRSNFNNRVYWLNYDGDPRRPDLDGLRLTHVAELVAEIPAERKLILLDHCYSGADDSMADIGSSVERGPSDPAPAVATPTVGSREAVPAELLEDIQAGAESVEKQGPAMFIVAASRGAALEFTEQQHGIFTFVLLRAFAEATADTGGDGRVSINELYNFVSTNVDRMTRERGFQQQTQTALAQTRDLNTTRWEPFVRKLSAAEVDAQQVTYRARLQDWASKGWLDPQVQTLAEALLLRWKNAGAIGGLDERDERAIAIVRWLLDNRTLEEAVAVSELSEQVRYWSPE